MPVRMEYTESLTVTHCWCGICVAVPDNLYSYVNRHRGKALYCPLGHEFVFSDTAEEKLERERRQHRATKDLLAAEERSHSATKGQMTKLRKRVEAGVCPRCKRTFQNLARHMETKHSH
jgi:hypothetical protein